MAVSRQHSALSGLTRAFSSVRFDLVFAGENRTHYAAEEIPQNHNLEIE
jgi:hypothetical protein